MGKKNIIIICIILSTIVLLGLIIFNIIINMNNNKSNNISNIKKDITIQGRMELDNENRFYIFNGEHFGESGIEMPEYTRAIIGNKQQKCIDYYTSEEYNTNYIHYGDILICKGDLITYNMLANDYFDTKNNPIIVLKAKDYEDMKKEALRNENALAYVAAFYSLPNEPAELYIRYEYSDKIYNLPFILKFNITDETEVIGELKQIESVR